MRSAVSAVASRTSRSRRLYSLGPNGAGAAVVDASAAVDAAQCPFDVNAAKPYSEVPGPKPLPFIGNTWRLLPVIGKQLNSSIQWNLGYTSKSGLKNLDLGLRGTYK